MEKLIASALLVLGIGAVVTIAHKLATRPTKPTRSAPTPLATRPAPAARAITRPAPVAPKPVPLHAAPRKPPIANDLIAIVGFSDTASIILPPSAISAPFVRDRVDQLASPRFFRGGMTNLPAGLDQALAFLQNSRNRVRRLVIVSDGEPNVDLARLPELTDRARGGRVSICSIFTGTGNSPVLQGLADKSVGGWHTSVAKIADLAQAIRKASHGAFDAPRSARRGIVVVAVDLSSSMREPLAGDTVSRIEATKRAIRALLDWHAAMYGQKVAA